MKNIAQIHILKKLKLIVTSKKIPSQKLDSCNSLIKFELKPAAKF